MHHKALAKPTSVEVPMNPGETKRRDMKSVAMVYERFQRALEMTNIDTAVYGLTSTFNLNSTNSNILTLHVPGDLYHVEGGA